MARQAATAKTRTSPRATRISKRGFTLIELTVVITILVLFAIGITPNLLSQKRSGDVRAFYSATRRIVSSARETAISTKEPIYLTYDDAQKRLVMSREDPETQEKTEVSHLSLPEDMRAIAFRLGGQDSNSADWSVGFYPDGSADAAGLQFERDSGQRSLAIAENGHPTLVDGDIPDTTTERWEAGTYEQRL